MPWGVIGSSKATNEESYLTQKLARQVIGTHNTDNCSRYCQAPATEGLWRTVGYGGDAGSISDMERAELVLVVGSNTSASHPVIAARLRRAQKLARHQLIVADLREHDLAARADLIVRPKSGTDLGWLSAVTRHILEQGWADQGSWTPGSRVSPSTSSRSGPAGGALVPTQAGRKTAAGPMERLARRRDSPK